MALRLLSRWFTTDQFENTLPDELRALHRGLIAYELERRPPIKEVNAAPDGRAVDIAGGVEDQAGCGLVRIRAVAEVMQHLRRPAPARGRYELEHRSPIKRAAKSGRAVEIAGSIEDQTGSRGTVVCVDAEPYQHLLRPAPATRGRQLEHHPVVDATAPKGRAVEIAGGIQDQA